MNLTKRMECPLCGKKSSFHGGSFGGDINTTNFKCDCGFSAWVIITQEDKTYSVSAEFIDRKKANPYNNKPKDQIIIEKHYIKEALDKTTNYEIIRACQKALSFIYDILQEK